MNIMHYVIYGKFHPQSRPLPANVKAFLWDKSAITRIFSNKFLNHPLKKNNYLNDVFFFEKAKMYRLDDQYDEQGNIIMLDYNVNQIFNYKEYEINQKSLTQIAQELCDPDITIELVNPNF
jgi:hypothetical protein